MQLSVELRGLGQRKLARATELHHPDMKAENTRSAPNTVEPRKHGNASVSGDHLRAKLRPLSWNVFVTEPG
jgi:alpha-N-arabinofuranosidase